MEQPQLITPTPETAATLVDRRQPHAKNDELDRGYWGHKAEFILSCIGLSVGIGNVWRFPYVAYDNGGGAFLIPYLLMLMVIGKPLYYLELSIGQYARLGPAQLFSRMSGLTAGIGFAMLYSCMLICVYYNVIMSYAVYFTVATIVSAVDGHGDEMPWEECDPEWADMNTCSIRRNDVETNASLVNFTASNVYSNTTKLSSSTEQYFYRKVLAQYDSGIPNEKHSVANLGKIVPELLGCLIVCWVVVYVCLVRGIRSSGKVVYLTATLPYVLLFVLLVRGLLLEGAWNGISYFITPTWDKLFLIQTWRAAATQLFYSLGTSAGSLIMFGSYNKFHNDCHFDAALVSALDTVTSIVAGFVVFAQLGNLAVQNGQPVEDVAKGGLGLAFVVYPEAISKLPWPHFFGTCFFAMLFTLGLDTQFALIEVILAAIQDCWPRLRQRRRRLWITLGVCAIGLVAGLPCVCQGGLEVVDLMDVYGGSFSILFIAVYELTAVGWIYGVDRFADDLHVMLHGQRPGRYWRWCWRYVAPLLLTLIVIATLADYRPLSTSSTYAVWWADALGWAMSLLAITSPPVVAAYAWVRSEGQTWRQKFVRARAPRKLWGSGDVDDFVDDRDCCGTSADEVEKGKVPRTTVLLPMS